jgi:hypothetical protein
MLVVASAVSAACTGGSMNEEPEPEYSEAEVFAPMEAEVAEIIEALPDFPGFASRSWAETPCYKDGAYTEDRVGVEITYVFDGTAAVDPLIRETYVDELRERWTEQGYEITWDEASATGKFYELEARREDGIKLWYSVAHGVALKIQSGCVPASDHGEIQYIPPSGGVVPGSPEDIMNHLEEEIQGYPEEPQEEAVSPFDASESASPPGMVPWSRGPGPTDSGLSSYEGQL